MFCSRFLPNHGCLVSPPLVVKEHHRSCDTSLGEIPKWTSCRNPLFWSCTFDSGDIMVVGSPIQVPSMLLVDLVETGDGSVWKIAHSCGSLGLQAWRMLTFLRITSQWDPMHPACLGLRELLYLFGLIPKMTGNSKSKSKQFCKSFWFCRRPRPKMLFSLRQGLGPAKRLSRPCRSGRLGDWSCNLVVKSSINGGFSSHVWLPVGNH